MRTSPTHPTGTAAQRAYDFAKWSILNAVYEGGDVITEGDLAHEVGVSRTPVREALLRLEVEGLVRLYPKRGAIVSSFSVQQAEDILETRALVENYTAAKSFAHRADLLPGLKQVQEDMKKRRRERDTAGFTTADRAFHELIVDAAGNAELSQVYRRLRERQTLFTSALMRGRPDRMDAAVAEHQRILDALRGDDERTFCDAVEAHLTWATHLTRETR